LAGRGSGRARARAAGSARNLGLVAEEEGRLIGFAEAAVRNYAEGAAGPAAYLEGIWVEPEHRRRGVARALVAAVENWGRQQGLSHLGSDALLDNLVSHRWHAAAGFAEIERLVVFGKPLR
jgi:aminoglycoside 6'-N-acetyltransferase I